MIAVILRKAGVFEVSDNDLLMWLLVGPVPNGMKKNFDAKAWLYPMPVLIIGSYDEEGRADAMNAAGFRDCAGQEREERRVLHDV